MLLWGPVTVAVTTPPPGTYLLTLTGTSPSATHTTTYTLTVTATVTTVGCHRQSLNFPATSAGPATAALTGQK